MKLAVARLSSASPYSQGRYFGDLRKDKESHKDYEERIWRERMHVNQDGFVIMPPMAFKNCLSEAAKYLGVQIPGKGKQNYTKHFEAGVLVTEPAVLPIKRADVQGERLHVPADGKRGGTKRVEKIFGLIPSWSADITFHILDETITQEVFDYHLRQAGQFIGVGRFRPRNNGYYGRFNVESLKWS